MRKVGFLLLLSACGGSIATTDAGTGADAGAQNDSAAPVDGGVVVDSGPPSSFCQGDTPKMLENGKDNPVMKVSGKAIIMNCCNAAAVTFSTAQHAALYTLRWQQFGAGPSPVVLGNKDTNVELDLGCDPTTTTCTSGNSVEHFTQGFSGTIKYQFVNSKMLVTYCVSVTETPSEPHTLVHSAQIYLPNVDSP